MEIEKVSGDYRPLILVAEDDDSNFKLIKAIIGKKCEILWAKNGEDIVNLFEENRDKAEAILMDIKMPIMNGLDATVIIRKKDKELPIIMQTAYACRPRKSLGVWSLGSVGKTHHSVCFAYMSKPLFTQIGLVRLY